jgi:hypothetical protein
MTTSLGTTNPQKNMTDSSLAFESWWAEHGIRSFSPNHGCADGHLDYMKMAFAAGYSIASKESAEVIKDLEIRNKNLHHNIDRLS